MKIEAFRFAKPGSTTREGKPFYVYMRRDQGGWRAISQAGIPEALSNFAEDAAGMSLHMDRCASAELAMDVFRAFARKGYVPEIV